jgi:hypothetical protein
VKRIRVLLGLLAFLAAPCVLASTIHVPKDQPTIQAGINAANNGDTVLVAPGKYVENINFIGKAITVTSSGGAKATVIDGGQVAPVVTFSTGEGLTSVLSRFTLQNGSSTFNSRYDGGGIYISSASPTIRNNIVQNNIACNGGGGISVEFGSPLIQANTIRNNSQQSNCSGGVGGGGISVGGAASAAIVGNVIENNTWEGGGTGFGGGITLFAAGTPTIENNIIRRNSAGAFGGSQGGGIWIVNQSDVLIVQNLIYNNTAGQGGGIYFLVPEGDRGPLLVNNTIVGGPNVVQGSAVFAAGFDNQVQFFNNLIIGLSGQNAVDCDGTYQQESPTFTNNDAYSPNGTGLQGTCVSQGDQNGNISKNPRFVSPSERDCQLLATSPAINAGTNSAPDLPKKDLAGHPRIVGGTIDIGAYEYQGKESDWK